MYPYVYMLIALLSSVIGAVCGIGGGIIIKPVLDAFGNQTAQTINFLSGCTVLAMTSYSVIERMLHKTRPAPAGPVVKVNAALLYREAGAERVSDLIFRPNKAERAADFGGPIGSKLIIGAVVGGLSGKYLFAFLTGQAWPDNLIKTVQAAALMMITLGTLLFTLFKSKIPAHKIKHPLLSILIGLVLGLLSVFLGIGGGPINIVVLLFFFSLPLKAAVESSLYIIFFSQLTGLLSTFLSGTVPAFHALMLGLMIIGGIGGGIIGRALNRKMSAEAVGKLLIGVMVIIIGINFYTICISAV